MPSEELERSWQRTERYLREALGLLDLGDHVGETALDFIAHNEFGVAFEYLTSTLVESDARLAEPARAALANAAEEMGLSDNADWRTLST